MLFNNREEAARLLAEKLLDYEDRDALILAVPRGAVPMAQIIADHIHGEIDVVLVNKIGAPDDPELAIGSVDERGEVFINEVALDSGYTKEMVRQGSKRELEKMRKRRLLYNIARPPAEVEGRSVIIVDDGIATGSTMLAAVRSLKSQKPSEIAIALGVAPPTTIQRLSRECDKVITIYTPANLFAVGHYYQDFRQVSDEEVIQILKDNYDHYKPSKTAKNKNTGYEIQPTF